VEAAGRPRGRVGVGGCRCGGCFAGLRPGSGKAAPGAGLLADVVRTEQRLLREGGRTQVPVIHALPSCV